MKKHATRTHLACVANNLGWTREAGRQDALAADRCPSRELILGSWGHIAAVETILCECERACVGLREAYNRRDLKLMIEAARTRAACLEQLATAMR